MVAGRAPYCFPVQPFWERANLVHAGRWQQRQAADFQRKKYATQLELEVIHTSDKLESSTKDSAKNLLWLKALRLYLCESLTGDSGPRLHVRVRFGEFFDWPGGGGDLNPPRYYF